MPDQDPEYDRRQASLGDHFVPPAEGELNALAALLLPGFEYGVFAHTGARQSTREQDGLNWWAAFELAHTILGSEWMAAHDRQTARAVTDGESPRLPIAESLLHRLRGWTSEEAPPGTDEFTEGYWRAQADVLGLLLGPMSRLAALATLDDHDR